MVTRIALVAAILLAVAAAAACRRAATHVEPIGHLIIRPMKIRPVTESGTKLPAPEAAMVLYADGTVEFQGKAVATVHADGRLVDGAGKELARLAADGRIGGGAPEPLRAMTIGPDGVVARDGKPLIAIDEAGVATPIGGAAMIRLDGPPEGRRAPRFVFLVASPE